MDLISHFKLTSIISFWTNIFSREYLDFSILLPCQSQFQMHLHRIELNFVGFFFIRPNQYHCHFPMDIQCLFLLHRHLITTKWNEIDDTNCSGNHQANIGWQLFFANWNVMFSYFRDSSQKFKSNYLRSAFLAWPAISAVINIGG